MSNSETKCSITIFPVETSIFRLIKVIVKL